MRESLDQAVVFSILLGLAGPGRGASDQVGLATLIRGVDHAMDGFLQRMRGEVPPADFSWQEMDRTRDQLLADLRSGEGIAWFHLHKLQRMLSRLDEERPELLGVDPEAEDEDASGVGRAADLAHWLARLDERLRVECGISTGSPGIPGGEEVSRPR